MASTSAHYARHLDGAAAAERAGSLMRDGLSCSESVFAAICEQAVPEFDRSTVRLATGFCGGVGRSHEELCGALAGGVMVVGLFWGRSEPGADSAPCAARAARWREVFTEHFGTSRCRPIYDRVHQPGASGSCADIAAEAAALLAELLNDGGTA